MNVTQATLNILAQLRDIVQQISDRDFSRPSVALSNSSIGQHLRHTLEFFLCLRKGVESGVVNYDKRSHDKLIETNKEIALHTISSIEAFVSSLHTNAALKLEVGYNLEQEEYLSLSTTVSRELVYNVEHAVHHMAIMKIGLREVAPSVKLPENFGVAASTVRYQQAVPQQSS